MPLASTLLANMMALIVVLIVASPVFFKMETTLEAPQLLGFACSGHAIRIRTTRSVLAWALQMGNMPLINSFCAMRALQLKAVR